MKKYGFQRILAFDLARFFAVVFMILIHCVEFFLDQARRISIFYDIAEILGGPPAAPVFVFLMGASFAFSRRTKIDLALKRGFSLLVLGYFLNFIRGSIPLTIALETGRVRPGELDPFTPETLFWTIDILHFAGLAIMIVNLIRVLLPTRPWAWMGIALAVMFFSPLLWGRMSGISALDWLIRLFWGVGGELVSFPVFPWLCFPLAGAIFGHFLVEADDKAAFFRRTPLIGLVLVGFGAIIVFTSPTFHIGDYYRSGPGAIILYIGFILTWIGCCHFLVKKLPSWFFQIITPIWSGKVTVFYCFHWLLIGWGLIFVGFRQHSIVVTIILTVIVAIAADILTRLWVNLRKRNKGHGTEK